MEIVWSQYLLQAALGAFPLFLGFFVALSVHSLLCELWYHLVFRYKTRKIENRFAMMDDEVFQEDEVYVGDPVMEQVPGESEPVVWREEDVP